ncbi:MAG: PAS domain S-box protein [Candidatus Thorarchaeota archaeon]
MSLNGDAHATDKTPPKTPKYLDLYFDIAEVILMAMDPEGRISLLNPKGCEIIGGKREAIIGTSWFDYIPDRHRDSVRASFQKLMAGDLEQIDYYERPLRTLKGEERIVEWRTNVLKNDQGKIIGLISSGEDITDRKRAEIGLEKRKYELSERLKELVCLYETSRLLSSNLPLSEIFQNLVYLMQHAWQYSDLTCARVQYLQETYQTDNFKETEWTQHSTIHLNGTKIGSLEVFYLEELPQEDDGPFVKEERKLIDALAENITIFLERLESEKKLQWELSFNKALAEIANALIATDSNIGDISAKVLEYSKMLTKSDYGYVSSIDPVTQDVVGHTLSEMMGDQCKLSPEKSKITFPVNDDGTYGSLWGYPLNKREAFYTNSPQSHASSKGLPHGHIPLRNFLSVPAIISGELVGQIALASSESDYTDTDLDTITRLGALYAIAISRKRIESTLQESEERQRLLLGSMKDMIFVYDRDDCYSQIYSSDESLLISPTADVIGQHVSERILPHLLNLYLEGSKKVRETGESLAFDYSLELEGKEKWFTTTISLHMDNESIVSTVREITDKVEAEQSLRESEERYRTLIQSMNDDVIVYDSDNRYVQLYASNESLLFSSPNKYLGKSISDVLPENLADSKAAIFKQVRETGESMTLDYPLQIDDREYWFSAANSLHEDGTSIVSVIRDITKRKELETEREQHRKELELYSSLLHHDIGNDLQVILGYLEIAEMESDSPDDNTFEMLAPVKNAAERMQGLLTILGSPREQIQTEMLQLVSKVAAKAQQVHKGLSVRISVARGAQPLRVVSSRLLPMVFENLFRNSVQFSESDPIVDVEMSKSDGMVIVEVSDNGSGISEELKLTLFQRGVSTTGSGLGLYLAKRILTTYNGSIELIDSKSGTGAAFKITLPMAK